MRKLTQHEIQYISGSSGNLSDAILTSTAFSYGFSLLGGIAGAIWYVDTTGKAKATLTLVYASLSGAPFVTLPLAIFAGIGIGGSTGAVMGLGLYYARSTSNTPSD
jgi:hypothetical protein